VEEAAKLGEEDNMETLTMDHRGYHQSYRRYNNPAKGNMHAQLRKTHYRKG
jgi:hypothetical protein